MVVQKVNPCVQENDILVHKEHKNGICNSKLCFVLIRQKTRYLKIKQKGKRVWSKTKLLILKWQTERRARNKQWIQRSVIDVWIKAYFQSHRFLAFEVDNSTQRQLFLALQYSLAYFDSNSFVICQLSCYCFPALWFGPSFSNPVFFGFCSFLVRHFRCPATLPPSRHRLNLGKLMEL